MKKSVLKVEVVTPKNRKEARALTAMNKIRKICGMKPRKTYVISHNSKNPLSEMLPMDCNQNGFNIPVSHRDIAEKLSQTLRTESYNMNGNIVVEFPKAIQHIL